MLRPSWIIFPPAEWGDDGVSPKANSAPIMPKDHTSTLLEVRESPFGPAKRTSGAK